MVMAKAAVEQQWWCGAAAVVVQSVAAAAKAVAGIAATEKKANDKRAGVGRPSEGPRMWDQSALKQALWCVYSTI